MNTPLLIYCAGGSPSAAQAAIATGFRYGAQLPKHRPYAPLYFVDNDYKHPNRPVYMDHLARHRPPMATVLDLMRRDQLIEVLDWAEEASQHAGQVLIIPKAHGVIARLPRRIGGAEVVLGYSVPTQHGGTCVWDGEFADWPVHILGGSPHAQMRLWSRLRRIAEVRSADGNMVQQQANSCRVWSAQKGRKGHWRQLSELGDLDRERGARLRAFERSCANIVAAWRALERAPAALEGL